MQKDKEKQRMKKRRSEEKLEKEDWRIGEHRIREENIKRVREKISEEDKEGYLDAKVDKKGSSKSRERGIKENGTRQGDRMKGAQMVRALENRRDKRRRADRRRENGIRRRMTTHEDGRRHVKIRCE